MTEAMSTTQLLELATVALLDGEPEATLGLCSTVLEAEPDHADARFLQAEAFRHLRDLHDAVSSYHLVLAHMPSHAGAWYGLGHALFDQGMFDDASQCIKFSLRLDSDQVDAYYARAILREQRGDNAGAARDYARITASYPTPPILTDADIFALLLEATQAQSDPILQYWIEVAPQIVVDFPDTHVCDAYVPAAPVSDILAHVVLPTKDDHKDKRMVIDKGTPSILLFRYNIARSMHHRDNVLESLASLIIAPFSIWLSGALGQPIDLA